MHSLSKTWSLSLSNTHMHRAAFYSMHIGVTKSYMELLKTEFLAMGLRENGKIQDKAIFLSQSLYTI